MNAVTLKYRPDYSDTFIVEHRCGKNAGYEVGYRAYVERHGVGMPVGEVAASGPMIRIWGDQGTFLIPEEILISLSFQEKLEKCPVCS